MVVGLIIIEAATAVVVIIEVALEDKAEVRFIEKLYFSLVLY